MWDKKTGRIGRVLNSVGGVETKRVGVTLFLDYRRAIVAKKVRLPTRGGGKKERKNGDG